MKGKFKKYMSNLFALLGAALILAGILLAGCSRREKLPELELKEETSSLKAWKDGLERGEEVLGISGKAIRGLEISRDGTEIFAISYEPRSYKDTFNYWDISVPYKSIVSVDTERMYELFDTVAAMIGQMQLLEDMTLEEAGVTDSQSKVFIACDSAQSDDKTGKAEPDKSLTLLLGKQNQEGDYYAVFDGSNQVYLVSGTIAKELLNIQPFQYILRVIGIMNVETVSDIELITEGKSRVMSRSENTYQFDRKNVSREEFQKLYTKLFGVLIEKEIPAGELKKTQDEAILTMNFHRNTKDAPDVRIQFMPYDDDSLRVSVNGKEFFLVAREEVRELIRNIENVF